MLTNHVPISCTPEIGLETQAQFYMTTVLRLKTVPMFVQQQCENARAHGSIKKKKKKD